MLAPLQAQDACYVNLKQPFFPQTKTKESAPDLDQVGNSPLGPLIFTTARGHELGT